MIPIYNYWNKREREMATEFPNEKKGKRPIC